MDQANDLAHVPWLGKLVQYLTYHINIDPTTEDKWRREDKEMTNH